MQLEGVQECGLLRINEPAVCLVLDNEKNFAANIDIFQELGYSPTVRNLPSLSVHAF